MDSSGNKFGGVGFGFVFQGGYGQVVAGSGGFADFFGDSSDALPRLNFFKGGFDALPNFHQGFYPFFVHLVEPDDVEPEHGLDGTAQFAGGEPVEGLFKLGNHHSLRKLSQTAPVGARARVVGIFFGHLSEIGAVPDLFQDFLGLAPGACVGLVQQLFFFLIRKVLAERQLRIGFDQNMTGLVLFFDEKFGLVGVVIVLDVFFVDFDFIHDHCRHQLDVLDLDLLRHFELVFVRFKIFLEVLVRGQAGGFEKIPGKTDEFEFYFFVFLFVGFLDFRFRYLCGGFDDLLEFFP